MSLNKELEVLDSLVRKLAVTIYVKGEKEDYWKKYMHIQRRLEKWKKTNPDKYLQFCLNLNKFAEKLVEELNKC
ncbi:MAG: hypothetical protein DRO11_08560 [Methanobacteriota archaeon]|nr:MAG: hypothetical protein DRO11_08560 [Euryarchaeota archaeon]